MPVTQNDLKEAVIKLGLSNSIICLHSSLKSFGYIEGGASSIVNAFLEQHCTIIVPTFFYDAIVAPPPEKRLQQNGSIYSEMADINSASTIPYSLESSFIDKSMGAIPAEVSKMDKSMRGNHPINSFAAVGPGAEEIIKSQNPMDVYAPFREIYESKNAFILLMGVDLTKVTPIHFSEQLSGRRLFRVWAKISDNESIETEVGSCSEGFNNFDLQVKEIEKRIKVGESLWRVFPFNQFVDTVTDAIKINPMITHCSDSNCIRCNDAVKGGPLL